MKSALTRAWLGRHEESGIVIIVAMIFIMIFLVIGLALYWLIAGQTRSTATERSDVKSINVAEAGIDAGMLTLKVAWPDQPSQPAPPATVDNQTLGTLIQSAPTGQAQSVHVTLYDNVDANDGHTITPAHPGVPNPNAPNWDSNKDGIMFVDSTGNVGNDRHRILIEAQKQVWNLTFPIGLALFANTVDPRGQAFAVSIENGSPPVYYDVHDPLRKGIIPGTGVTQTPNPTTFSSCVTPALQAALMGIAQNERTYYTDEAKASDFLTTEQAYGKVVYIKSNSAVKISGKGVVGSKAQPVVVIIYTPDGSNNLWDFTGTCEFNGILVTLGNSELRGTVDIYGALYCDGTLRNDGGGSVYYDQQVIDNIRSQHIIDVNIMPNSWEEYTPLVSGP